MRGRIDGLIRLQRWQLDEKRRNLADLEGMRQDFEDRCTHLDAEVEREKAAIAANPDGGYGLGDFLQASFARKKSLLQSIRDIDAEIETARDAVQAAFEELKKLEMFDARQKRNRKLAEERREQADLDEIGLTRHRRRAAEF